MRDLGSWMLEEYVVSGEDSEEEAEVEAKTDGEAE